MRSKLLVQSLILTLVVTGLTGCRNGKWIWSKDAKPAGAQPGPLGGDNVGTSGSTGTRSEGYTGTEHSQFTPVYFDYDSSKIKPSEFSKLEAVAAALKGNSNKLTVEGHTDERGTAEYNRALGERRAQSAKTAITSLGIKADRISTVSYGKDRPAEPSHDDTAWSRNRRCEFVVTGQ